jgi:hypothetical protein
MTTKPQKADDDIDALEALESEEKEFNKVSSSPPQPPDLLTDVHLLRMQKLIVF